MGMVQIVENLIYQDGAGEAGRLDLYLPQGRDCKALFVFFHGGGLESGDKADDKGVCRELAEGGIAVASANYRMYPDAVFPQYIEDAAKAVVWCMAYVKEYVSYKSIVVGGISAGAYLSMMLHFCPRFLAECGVDEKEIKGYVFDAGQPTVHFNVLRERGQDSAAVRIDEAAPLFYLEGVKPVAKDQRFLVVVSDNDIPGRREQNELLIRTMETHQYDRNQITYRIMEGYTHAGYVGATDENGSHPYAQMLKAFMETFCD